MSESINFKAIAVEFFAMTMFIYTGCGSATIFGAPADFNYSLAVHEYPSFGIMVPLVFGTAVMALVYTTGHMSAGQLNPAVTIGLMLAKKESIQQGIGMIIAQFFGSLLGVGFLAMTIPYAEDSQFGANSLANQVTPGNAFMGEMMMTMFLMHVILSTTSDENQGCKLGPVIIGLTVFFGHGILLPLDGCSLNPARSFGPAAISGQWEHFEVFFFGPIFGACLAVPMFYWMNSSSNNNNTVDQTELKRLQINDDSYQEKGSA
eukprot:TRINITY_DN4216_c0_g1_i7.p1 TRINITY_DN4216_c0_g1~~TRINITY_DN4216_c0_g1_i7.p1  ORF type:complete len:262 (+),score=42.09 TRINITY_DN4216_c0_g1_i7:49-834(+)